ncbi:adoMet-dependent rRNA methyltransferase spb1-like [Solanum pennellii]|uniref:Putative rRNA methyltransferase n=1 Tax=Solanum pennellii TaxID=28526 RepID=A0ABM1FEI4_SOLPN|nr:adoMet-dependent rRNA methyltransferase spb1-like [Solanum pennellii]
MGKLKGRDRRDKYYHLAKESRYRSRAAFKLMQLNSKFSFLTSSQSVLDLCAAPGGWLQVVVKKVPVGSLVIGVDIDPIRPIAGAISLQEDITTAKCKSTLKRIIAQKGCSGFDLILHDGSPNMGGAWAMEATMQNSLVIDSVKLAAQFLLPNGTFVTKVFRSQDYTAVLYCLRQLFEKVEVEKPLASRSESAEIYVIGFKYKAPAKIDPRLLDIKHLFQGGKEPLKVVDVLRATKQKRHRDGYEDGETVLRKVCSAADFVWSDIESLGSVTSIMFDDPASLPMRDHPLTTEEVRTLCEDLRVLGEQDLKHLSKWRKLMRKALAPSETISNPKVEIECEREEDEDTRLVKELEELKETELRKTKREKRVLAKKQAKDKAREVLRMQSYAAEDGFADPELFSLTLIKCKRDVVLVDDNECDDGTAEVNSEADGNDLEAAENASTDMDSEEDRLRRDDEIEGLLEDHVKRDMTRGERKTKRSKISYLDDCNLLERGEEDGMTHSAQDSDSDKGEDQVNPLIIPLETAPSQEEVVKTWFTQDVFVEPEEQEMLDKYHSEDEMLVVDEVTPISKSQTTGELLAPILSKKRMDGLLQVPSSETPNDFEIVPVPPTYSSDSSSDESGVDIDRKAEILSVAKKLILKKQREAMMDDGYNKYMFDDEGLPKWFVDEEKKHRQLIMPVTKEEIAAMRAQFKEINARPAKKVAEAKARKKRAAQRKLEKIRKKANSISDQADVSDRSKSRMIEQLYRKATPKRAERQYVVAKKGVQVKVGRGKVLVDRRMKKDARRHGMRKQGLKKGGRDRKP